MGYYTKLANEAGIPGKTLRETFEFVFQSPTDERLRALGAIWAAARPWLENVRLAQGVNLAAIIAAEREWLHSHLSA